MRYRTTIAGQVFDFEDLKQVMAIASPARTLHPAAATAPITTSAISDFFILILYKSLLIKRQNANTTAKVRIAQSSIF